MNSFDILTILRRFLVVWILLSYCRGYKFSKTISANHIEEFQLKDYSYGSNIWSKVTINVNIYEDIAHNSRLMCDIFLQHLLRGSNNITLEMLSEFDQLRCRIPMFQSLRLKRMLRFSKFSAEVVAFPKASGYFLSLAGLLSHLDTSSNYDSSAKKYHHICLVGDSHIFFHHPILITLATLRAVYRVSFLHLYTLFNDKVNSRNTSSSVYADFSSSFPFNESLATAVDPTFSKFFEDWETQLLVYSFESASTNVFSSEYFNLLPSDCDMVILTLLDSMETLSNSLMQMMLDHLLQETSVRENNVMRLLNVRANIPIPTSVYREDLFAWHLSSIWQSISFIHEVQDCNGFSSKNYEYYNNHPFVAHFLLGTYRLSSESSNLAIVSNNGADIALKADQGKLQRKYQKIVAVQPHQVILLITYTIRVFAETALALKHLLQEVLDFPHVFIVLEVTADLLGDLPQIVLQDDSHAHNANMRFLQIAIGPHEVTTLLHRRRYIAWHMEQSWSIFFSSALHNSYDSVLANALQVWMFSASQLHNTTAQRLIDLQQAENSTDACQYVDEARSSLSCWPKLHVVPMYSYQSSIPWMYHNQRFVSRKVYEKVLPEDSKQYRTMPRVLMYGSCSERRLNMIRDEYLPTFRLANIEFIPACGGWDSVLFDNRRDSYIDNVDLVLNLNSYNASVLEVHRLQYLLGRGKCILSEHGTDPELVQQYEGIVHFIRSASDAVSIIHYLTEETFDIPTVGDDHGPIEFQMPTKDRFVGQVIHPASFVTIPIDISSETRKSKATVPFNANEPVQQQFQNLTYQTGFRRRLEACEQRSRSFFEQFHSKPEAFSSPLFHKNYATMRSVMHEALYDLAVLQTQQ